MSAGAVDPYTTKCVSGTGTTWGTSITGLIPAQWSVADDTSVTIAAAISNSSTTLGTGMGIGLAGYDYPVPFYEYGGTITFFPTRLPSNDNVSFRVTNAQTSEPDATVYDYSSSKYYLQAIFPYGEGSGSRTNLSPAVVTGSTTDYVNDNAGYTVHAYYEPAGSQSLIAWDTYDVYNDDPYVVNVLNAVNYFGQPLNENE
ncbi:MAG: hypothetical protein WBA31_11100 [Candidatus Dormiibacterota bacterium]